MSELRSFKIPAQSILEIGEDGQMDHKRNGRKPIKLLPKFNLKAFILLKNEAVLFSPTLWYFEGYFKCL